MHNSGQRPAAAPLTGVGKQFGQALASIRGAELTPELKYVYKLPSVPGNTLLLLLLLLRALLGPAANKGTLVTAGPGDGSSGWQLNMFWPPMECAPEADTDPPHPHPPPSLT